MSQEIVCVLAPLPLGPIKAGPPFVVTETLTVHEAAMIYRDRHPAGGFLRDLNIYDPKHIAKLEDWIGRRDPPPAKLLGDLRMEPEEPEPKKKAPEPEEKARIDEWLNIYFGGDEVKRRNDEEIERRNDEIQRRNKRDAEQNARISWEVASELSAAIASGAIRPTHIERDPQGRPIPLVCTIRLTDLLAIARRRGDAGEIVSSLATWYESAEPEPQTRATDGTLPRGTVKNDTVRACYEAHIKERGSGVEFAVPSKREAFRNWAAAKYPDDIPAGTGVKALRRDFEAEKKITISERTIRRALGRR
jgi:hypothetical protein